MIENVERPTQVTQYEKRVVNSGDTIETTQPYQEKKEIWRSYNTIWFVVGLINALLAFRFIFELLGANPTNTFVQLIYTLSFPFAEPFQTIFGVTSVARATFDWSLLVAFIVYTLIGYALVQILRIVHPVTREDVHQQVHTV